MGCPSKMLSRAALLCFLRHRGRRGAEVHSSALASLFRSLAAPAPVPAPPRRRESADGQSTCENARDTRHPRVGTTRGFVIMCCLVHVLFSWWGRVAVPAQWQWPYSVPRRPRRSGRLKRPRVGSVRIRADLASYRCELAPYRCGLAPYRCEPAPYRCDLAPRSLRSRALSLRCRALLSLRARALSLRARALSLRAGAAGRCDSRPIAASSRPIAAIAPVGSVGAPPLDLCVSSRRSRGYEKPKRAFTGPLGSTQHRELRPAHRKRPSHRETKRASNGM